jgi:hypothetical protein
LVGTLRLTPLNEHPVAVPLVTVKLNAPPPEPPDVTIANDVLNGDAVEVMMRGEVGTLSELEIV